MSFTQVKTAREIDHIRESGRMLAAVHKLLDEQIGPGHTTAEADALAAKELKKLGGQPAFYNYGGFPATLCVSVNDEIVHGIPGRRRLNEGDIVSFDFGVNYLGMITDSAFTKILGQPTPEQKRLLEGTRQSLEAAVNIMRGGIRVGDISAAVEAVLKKHNLGIVRQYVGHGVGHQLHEEPSIPNYGPAGSGPLLSTGMTVAVEPMAMLGGEDTKVLPDGWTVATVDGSLSAHFEHTILLTDDGAEVLTARD